MSQISLWQISDIDNEIIGILHGTTLNQITNRFGAYNRAARRVLEDVDPAETIIVDQFGKLYDGVFDYDLAAGVKGNKLIDLFPQANRDLRDNFSSVYTKAFDLWKRYGTMPDFTPRYNNGKRTIRINATQLNTGISLNPANAYNGDGTFVAGANVSNVTTNGQYMVDGGSGSVQFDIAQTGVAGSLAEIRNITGTAVDLSTHYNNSDIFFAVYLPNAAGITGGLVLKFGTDSSNYYVSGAITTDSMGQAFVNGWNIIKIPWANFTKTGTPTNTSIGQYLSVTLTYNGTAQTQLLLNQFWSRLGVIFNESYYSKYLFRNFTTGAFQERVTDTSDYVNLDTDGLGLFLWASVGEIVAQQQGLDALFFDANQAELKYQESLRTYRQKYKGETTKPGSTYYDKPNGGYRRFIGGSYRIP